MKLDVLAERQFRRYFLAQTTSWLGDGLLPVAIAFAVLDLTGSAADLGLVLGVRIVPLLVFVLAGGVWADRLPRQLVMVGSDVVRGATQAILAALLLTGSAELWHLIALQAIYGAGEAFWRPASTALLPSIVSEPQLQQANSLMAIAVNGSYTVGPAVAGVLVAAAGSGFAIAVDAVTFGISAAALLTLRVPALERPGEAPSFVRELREGWDAFASREWLWVIVAWSSVFLMLVFAPLMVLGPFVADRDLGGAKSWGVIAAATGIGVILGSAAAARIRPSRPLSVGALVWALPLAVFALSLALTWPVVAIAAVGFVVGAGEGFFEVIWITTVQQRIAPSTLARVTSYDALGSFLFLPLGFALAGPAAEAFGIRAVLFFVGGFAVASALLVPLLPSVRGLKRLEEPRAEVAEGDLLGTRF